MSSLTFRLRSPAHFHSFLLVKGLARSAALLLMLALGTGCEPGPPSRRSVPAEPPKSVVTVRVLEKKPTYALSDTVVLRIANNSPDSLWYTAKASVRPRGSRDVLLDLNIDHPQRDQMIIPPCEIVPARAHITKRYAVRQLFRYTSDADREHYFGQGVFISLHNCEPDHEILRSDTIVISTD